MKSVSRLKARKIILGLGISDASDLKHLDEICWTRGAYVQRIPLLSAEGRLIVRRDRGIISVRPSESYESRTRFSIAHELGHFELHRHVFPRWNCSLQDMSELPRQSDAHVREVEANEFAAEILMPELFLRRFFLGISPSLELLREVARIFGTSLTATALRFLEITEEACALVFWRNERVTHAWKSRAFSDLGYWIPSREIRMGSQAKLVASGERCTQTEPVAASAWLDLPEGLEPPELWEDADYFKYLNLGISLLWVRS